MAKKSKRRPLRSEKDQSSCISGLISIFDFRQGRTTQKLLSDRKCGTKNAASGGYSKSRRNLLTSLDDDTCYSSDDGDSKKQKVDGAKTSVKKLIEEEMSNEQHPKQQIGNAAVIMTQSDSKNGNHLRKNHKQATKSCSGAYDMHVHDSKASASLEYQQPCDTNSEGPSSNKINLASVMEKFCNQFHNTQEAHPHHENGARFCDVQERTSLVKHNHLEKLNMVQSPNISEILSEATDAFLNQKFVEAEQQNRGHQSKLFTDALEMLNSNKELFLKLLQDPNSQFVKNIQDLRDAQTVAGQTKPLPEQKMGNSRVCEKLVGDEKLQRQNVRTFFTRKIKSQNINPSKGSNNPQALNRIVLLKPGPEGKRNSGTETSPRLRNEEQSMRITSRFSLTEIRRKLKHAMGERKTEHCWPPIEGALDRIPYKRPESERSKGINEEVGERNSPRESNFHIERNSSPLNIKGRGKVSQPKEHEPGRSKDCEPITGHEDAPTSVDGQNINTKNVEDSKQRETNIYIQAIKHLANMVSTGEDVDLSSEQIPKALGRILSLPEYCVSPRFHPGRDKEHGSVTAQMRVQLHDNVQMINENVWQLKEANSSGNLSPLRQNIETPPCNNDDKADSELQVPDSDSDISQKLSPDSKIQESTCSANQELSPEVDVNSVEITNIKHPAENIHLEMLSTTSQITATTKIFEEEETSECLKLDSYQENQSSSSALGPSSPSSVQKNEVQEGINDKPEQPSPVSVLELFIQEDVISPGITVSQSVEAPIQPLQIHLGKHDSSDVASASSDPETYVSCMEDKKSTFDHVKAVLIISGLSSWDEFLRRWQYSDQLLDPPLFDEVEALSGQLCSDQKLLFDCINEVLVEIYERYFGCSPWVSFRPILVQESLIPEVWKGIDSHLLPPNQPLTLDWIVEKDMAKARKWMDLRFDIEIIGKEMGDIILEELKEETIYELCT